MKTLGTTLLVLTSLSCLKSTEAKPPDPGPSDSATTSRDAGFLGTAGHGGFGKVLLPPATPGEARSRLEGCLAQAETTEESGSRFPARAGTRSAPQEPVQLSVVAGGVLLTHELSHACCLKAEVTSKLEGTHLTVRETLSGSPCRCLCQSTVKTAVGLAPGRYQLALVQDGQGPATSVLETELEVK